MIYVCKIENTKKLNNEKKIKNGTLHDRQCVLIL